MSLKNTPSTEGVRDAEIERYCKPLIPCFTIGLEGVGGSRV